MLQGKETWNLAKVNSLTQGSGVAQQTPRPLSTTAAPEAPLTYQRSNILADAFSSVALPHELPRNVQELLRGYFEKHQTTQVPSEIYNLQVYRTYSTVEGRPAIYVAHPSGEHLTVHAYRLPQMNDTKHSSRLLVAEGRPFDEPVVLARTASHSRQYRAWKGALDDPSAPPVVLRQIVGGGKHKKRQLRSSAGTGTAVMRQPVLGKRKSFKDDPDHLDESHLEADTTENTRLRDNPEVPSQRSRSPDDLILEPPIGDRHYSEAIEQEAGLVPPPNPPDTESPPAAHRQAPNTNNEEVVVDNGTAPHHIEDKRSVTTLNFVSYPGAQKRRRNLLDCGDYYTLLRNALAGDVFPAFESVHVLSATINHRQPGIIVADDLDFQQLARAIEEDDCWKEVGGRCQVRIERYKQKEFIKAEH